MFSKLGSLSNVIGQFILHHCVFGQPTWNLWHKELMYTSLWWLECQDLVSWNEKGIGHWPDYFSPQSGATCVLSHAQTTDEPVSQSNGFHVTPATQVKFYNNDRCGKGYVHWESS